MENYNKLPKSRFDNEECVIVKEIFYEDHGYGHHSYEGIGINENGSIVWCYSSGCSCDGSCGMDHTRTEKAFIVEGFNISDLKPDEIDFESISVGFESY